MFCQNPEPVPLLFGLDQVSKGGQGYFLSHIKEPLAGNKTTLNENTEKGIFCLLQIGLNCHTLTSFLSRIVLGQEEQLSTKMLVQEGLSGAVARRGINSRIIYFLCSNFKENV